MRSRGWSLVAAGPGNGKTTTLAALVEDLVKRRTCRVVTVEEPVEYLLRDRDGVVVQREVGTDVPSTAAALRAVSRQDVDVLVVGDLGDPEVAELALEAAESGRLVLAGMTAGSVAQAIERLTRGTDEGGADRRARAWRRSLRGVLFQRLTSVAPNRRGRSGRCCAPRSRPGRSSATRPPRWPVSSCPEAWCSSRRPEPPRKRRAGETRDGVEDETAGD